MLVRTFGVIARATRSFVLTDRFQWVNLVAEGQGQEAACYILRKAWMVAVRLEHTKRAFIRSEPNRLILFLFRGHLFVVS